MRAVLLAQGDMTRLAHQIDYPKQFLLVNGEPIVGRTVRLLRERNVTDIVVVAHDLPRWRAWSASEGVPIETLPDRGVSVAQGAWRSRHLFSEETIVLLGDVVFSRAALDIVIRRPIDKVRIFTSGPTNPMTTKLHDEIYGLALGPRGRSDLDAFVASFERESRPYTLHTLRDLWGESERVLVQDWTDDIDIEVDVCKLIFFSRMAEVEEEMIRRASP